MIRDDEIDRLAETRRGAYFALSDRIWDHPELNYQEHLAAEHAALLEREGFRVRRSVAGIPTAVVGEAGPGGPGDRYTR